MFYAARDEEEEECLTAVVLVQAIGAVLSEVTHFIMSNTLPMRLAGKHPIGAGVWLDSRGLGGQRGGGGVLFGKFSFKDKTGSLTEQQQQQQQKKCCDQNQVRKTDLPSYGWQFRKERSSMAMSPVKSSPTVPSIKICMRKNKKKVKCKLVYKALVQMCNFFF